MQRGVSLIELVIGLVITAILFALGAPSFSNFIQNSKIRNAADAIQNGLALARGEAVKRNANVQFILDNSGASWTVKCEVAVGDANGDGLADCPGSSPAATSPYPYIENRTDAEGSTNVVVTTSEISGGAAVPAPIFTTALTFNGLGKVTGTTLAVGNSAVFDISPTTGTCEAVGGTARCMEIVVMSAGQIRMCDPKLTLSKPNDPQAC